MKKYSPLLIVMVSALLAQAQNVKTLHLHAAFFNAGNAMPFSNFTDLIKGPYHPGVEVGAGFNWSTKKRQDWFQDLNLSFFHHRFVQHAVAVNTEFGYRYKFPKIFSLHTAVGAGYMHAIPATGVYKLADGNYKNSKGIGRPQANATFAVGLGIDVKKSAARQLKIFIDYKERLQFPFVKSYVPLLPYNNLVAGVSLSFRKPSITKLSI